MNEPPAPDGTTIPLSRWRAALARARRPDGQLSGRALVDALLDQPDPDRFVQGLPMQELYYTIREVGLHDAQALVALASPEQCQGFLDLAAWQRDSFRAEGAAEWLDAVVDAGPVKLAQVVAGLDEELVSLFIRRQVRVYDLDLDQPPDEPEGHFYPTPDSFFLLDILPPGEAGKRIERLLDWLYRADLDVARHALQSARAALDSELVELAYRWRSGRMADLGYPPLDEALGIYAYLDPATVRLDGPPRPKRTGERPLPMLLAQLPGDGGWFPRALAELADPEELGRIHQELLWLTNRVLAADGAEPGDSQAARDGLSRASTYLGLGLELLGRQDLAQAVLALRRLPLERLFRLGWSVTVRIQQAAGALAREAHLTVLPGQLSLLGPEARAVVAAAQEPRPRFVRPPAPPRLFRSLAEIAETVARLDEVAQLAWLVERGLGVPRDRLSVAHLQGCTIAPSQVTFDTVLATLLANHLLDRPPAAVPLGPADLAPLRRRAIHDGRLRPTVRAELLALLEARLGERGHQPPAAFPRLAEAACDHLEAALAPSVVGAPGALPGTGTDRLLVRA